MVSKYVSLMMPVGDVEALNREAEAKGVTRSEVIRSRFAKPNKRLSLCENIMLVMLSVSLAMSVITLVALLKVVFTG